MERIVTSTPVFIKGSTPSASTYRVQSIDLLRGIIMIFMALDHVRDYFHAGAFTADPLDLDTTTPALYFTRWITHFCAPLFMFLSGISASLVGQRKGKAYLTRFLLTRGLWLVFLEFTVVCFAWFANPGFTTQLFGVIWALGISMIFLAGLIHFPKWLSITLGLIIVSGHNLLDGVQVTGTIASGFAWALFHQFNFFQFGPFNVIVAYPLIPWIGVMLLGYCLGDIFSKESNIRRRKKILLSLGLGAISLFILLRFINIYGDPFPWSQQSSTMYTFLSFIKVHKYPPSLLYLSVTIGPGLVFLSLTENLRGSLASKINTIGRVPMFYYLAHLYLIHTVALIAAVASGRPWTDMVNFSTWVTSEPRLQGYGFSLGVTYLIWIGLLVILYFLCKWYDRYKSAHREKWWLTYL